MPDQPSPNAGAGYRGFQNPDTGATDFGTLSFIIRAILSEMATTTLVKVMAVTNAGSLAAPGTVDILPLVNMLDGANNAYPHRVVYGCPYMRWQGGTNMIVLDPQVGDIGIAVFASRDISSVIANKGQANPGSRRQYSMADGLYLGSVLNPIATQFIQFSLAGIRIHSTNLLQLDAPNIILHADEAVVINADASMTITTPTLTINGDVNTVGVLTNNSIDVGSGHLHSGVSTGIQNTGPPIP